MVFPLELNYLAIIISAIVGMVIGAVWYGALAKPWMELNNFTKEDIEKDQSPLPYVIAFISSLLFSILIFSLVEVLMIDSLIEAVQLIAGIWLVFIFSSQLTIAMYSDKPIKLVLIDTGKEFAQIIAITLIAVYFG